MSWTALCGALGLAVCLSAVPLAHSTAGQGRALAWKNSYYQTIDRYCAGGFAAVSRDALAWTGSDLNRALEAALALDARQKMAAAALHVEVVAAQWRDEDGPVLMDHGMLARGLANESRHAGTVPSGLVRSWALAWGYLLLSHTSYAQAERHFATMRTWFPKDADFTVAGGIVNELLASPLGQQTRRSSVSGSLAAVDAQPFRARAIALYRAALDTNPDHAEAHLRLGRMLFLNGDETAAAAELQRALASSEDRRLAYLAHLFLGALFERQGRLPEADRQYEMSAAAAPGAQTAALALTALRIRMGKGPAVPAAMVQYDPWNDYLFSRPYRFLQSLDELRQAACR